MRPSRTFLHVVGTAAVAASVLACGRDETRSVPPTPAAPPAAPGRFTDVTAAARLRFRMQFLPGEQGVEFKANLYDHGTGVSVADVDGDADDDVYFVNQLGRNALFRNDTQGGHARFTEVTEAAGVGVGDRVCVASTFGDADGDGDQDLYVTSVRGGNLFFENDGKGRFTDRTQAAGLVLVAHSGSAAFFDYDLDGDLDLYVANTAKWTQDTRDPEQHYFPGGKGVTQLAVSPPEQNVLYRNDGVRDGHARFTDVTAAAGAGGVGWGSDTAVVDYDQDGRPDLLVGNMFGSSVLYRNQGDGTFTDVTRAALGRTSWGTVGVKSLDYDNDGRFDLALVDMHSDMWMPFGRKPLPLDERRKYAGLEGPMVEWGLQPPEVTEAVNDLVRVRPAEVVFGNTLFRNLGEGRFEEVSDRAGFETLWPWGIAAADFDADGWVDMFVPSGMGHPYFYWRNYLLMNRGDGTFEDRSRTAGIDPPAGGETLEERIGGEPAARSSRSAAVLDFDADGRPDLVVVNFNDRASLLRNEFPVRRWVGFRLTGTASNRDAISAVVRIRAGGRAQVRQVEAASGYLAQSTKTLLFGLGDASRVESCEIRWPSGTVQTVPDLRLDSVNAITEPRGTPRSGGR